MFSLVFVKGSGLTKIVPQLDFAVPTQLEVGDEIGLELKLTANAASASINLVTEMGSDGMPYNTIYRHRFDLLSNVIRINSKVNGIWTDYPVEYPSPVKKGEKFDILIHLGEDGINSTVRNQTTFYASKHPISSIKYITIIDDHWQPAGNIESVGWLHFNFAKRLN
ncbi:uncharacterized protein LOC143918546 [Arctopsyche grandis]|uniref:uncharacterized protein LOC143918546 n=1 Tax=Arctopsyche grandis TaxID=121162 RepID=UPI00406D7396